MKEQYETYFQQYLRGVSYKNAIGLYERVRENEDFYVGKQWEGVGAPDLDKPVLNILGRVVSYLISVLVGERIGVRGEVMDTEDPEGLTINNAIATLLDSVFEENALVLLAKDLVRNMAVDGDSCLHLYYDPQKRYSNKGYGAVVSEIIENTNIYFGNPACADKEKQPYILISCRLPIEQVKEEMAFRGVKQSTDALRPDSSLGDAFDDGLPKVTVITRYEKKKGTVWISRFTQTVVLIPETDLGYSRYPLAYMSWTPVKNSFHGQAALTGMIPNQIAINKLMAMAIKYEKELGLHKILYDRTKIDDFSNKIGAIAVNGDPSTAIFRPVYMPELPTSMLTLIDRIIAYTRDLMGASDAALGQVNPDNASAIITVVQSTAVPLVLQRRTLYGFYEEVVRIILDIATIDYGTRKIDANTPEFDYRQLEDYLLRLNIDAGEGSFYSESDQVRTLDKLFSSGIINDPMVYLDAIPTAYLPNKAKIIAALQKEQYNNVKETTHD